jgi:hypothetical protein
MKRPITVVDLTRSSNEDDDDERGVAVLALVPPYAFKDVGRGLKSKEVTGEIEDYYARKVIPHNVWEDIMPRLMTLSDELYRAASSLGPAVGLGLYCRRDILCGELITYYDGLRMDYALFDALKTTFAASLQRVTAYAHPFGTNEQVIVSDLVDRTRPNMRQLTQTKPLGLSDRANVRQLALDSLGATYATGGAMQFANTVLTSKDSRANARHLFIQDRRRFTGGELRKDIVGEPLEADPRLVDAFPEAAVVVLYAGKKIPANTEILYYYGIDYVRTNFGCARHGCEELAEYRCARCKVAYYCSALCQSRAWLNDGHAVDCFE